MIQINKEKNIENESDENSENTFSDERCLGKHLRQEHIIYIVIYGADHRNVVLTSMMGQHKRSLVTFCAVEDVVDEQQKWCLDASKGKEPLLTGSGHTFGPISISEVDQSEGEKRWWRKKEEKERKQEMDWLAATESSKRTKKIAKCRGQRKTNDCAWKRNSEQT